MADIMFMCPADRNECTDGSHQCEDRCENSDGGYSCHCDTEGYHLDTTDNLSCVRKYG